MRQGMSSFTGGLYLRSWLLLVSYSFPRITCGPGGSGQVLEASGSPRKQAITAGLRTSFYTGLTEEE